MTTETKRWVLLAVALGCLQPLLRVPLMPLFGDDWTLYGYSQQLIGAEQGYAATPFDLFNWVDGDPENIQRIMDNGFTPWFTSPEIRVAFWRPLASATHTLEFSLFGATPMVPLIHSLIWYALLCAVVAALYQRWLPGRTGGVAGVLFAIAGSHQQAASWICARNATQTALFGMLALWAHLRWREDGWRPGLWASLLALALGLASGESTLGALCFVGAWELFAARDSVLERAKALGPAALVTALWLTAYVLQGYGASGSLAYVDPFHQPLQFLSILPVRLSFSMGVLFLGIPAHIWVLAGGLQTALAAVGLVGAAGLVLWMRAVWPDWSDGQRSTLTWLSAGMLLSLIPQMGGQLGPRSFVIASVGSFAILACLAVDAWGRAGWRRVLGVGAVGVAHVALVGVGYIAFTALYVHMDTRLFRAIEVMELDEPAPGRQPILLTAPDVLVGVWLPAVYAALHGELLTGFRAVSVAECDHELTHAGSKAFRLRTVGCAYFETPFEQLLRAPDQSNPVGSVVQIQGMEVEVVAVDDAGRPLEVEVRLDRDLSDAELWAWHEGEIVRVTIPKPGEPQRLAWNPPF